MGGFKYKHLYHKLFFRLPIVISLLICFRNKKNLLLPRWPPSSSSYQDWTGLLQNGDQNPRLFPPWSTTNHPPLSYIRQQHLIGNTISSIFFLPSSYFDALGQKQNIRLPLFFFRNIFPVLCSSLLVVIKCAF